MEEWQADGNRIDGSLFPNQEASRHSETFARGLNLGADAPANSQVRGDPEVSHYQSGETLKPDTFNYVLPKETQGPRPSPTQRSESHSRSPFGDSESSPLQETKSKSYGPVPKGVPSRAPSSPSKAELQADLARKIRDLERRKKKALQKEEDHEANLQRVQEEANNAVEHMRITFETNDAQRYAELRRQMEAQQRLDHEQLISELAEQTRYGEQTAETIKHQYEQEMHRKLEAVNSQLQQTVEEAKSDSQQAVTEAARRKA